ncbi:MAG: lamin tail domain-containing protein [Verrucomicrobiales bacterium]
MILCPPVGLGSLLRVLAVIACGSSAALASPMITEIVADSDGSHLDENGEASDWLEIHNPDVTAADLAGWHLTDNAGSPTKWTFPAGVTLGPGEFLVVWASGKNRTADPARLHTNFALNAGGEYVALVQPGGGARVSEYAPAFPALQEGESYGAPFVSEPLVSDGATARIRVPADGSLGTEWTGLSFVPDGGWATGATAIGFGMPTPGFFIEARRSTGTITTISTAESVLGGTNAADLLTAVTPVVNFTGPTGSDGRFGDGVPMLHEGDASNFALRATATLVIPTAGPYTFHVNSDDGFRLRIDGSAVLTVTGTRSPADSLITRTLTAGSHTLVLTYFENTGGDEVELSATPGTHTVFSNVFRLVGDTANGGLAVLAPETSGQSAVATDLRSPMQDVNASAYVRLPFTVADPASLGTLELALRYNDGFIAYLNGTEIARRLAPSGAEFNSSATGSRTALQSLLPEKFSLHGYRSLLQPGANVLAVHGLNVSAADSSFYLAPSLTSGRSEIESARFFRTPTPAAPNAFAGFLGHVADTTFSSNRGFYSSPIALTIATATPGASIRYTLDGSTPSTTRGLLYESPITIDKTTVVRAMAHLDDYEPTNVDTHTYVFLNDVILQGGTTAPYRAKPGPDWPNPGSLSGQVIDYGMDRSIINNSNATLGGQTQVKAALSAIPSVFITTDVPNLFHATTGIYTHAGSHGRTWERPASIELMNDPNTPEGGFHASCGIRIRGGYSRSGDNPKHSFRIFFRRDYGAGTLQYPVFGASAATEFDAFDVQCSQNYSWSFHGDSNHNALREIWCRDAHADLGHQATRGRFVHLYLNGVYWGLFQLQERAEAAYGATYFGGNKDDYDVIKHTGSPGGYTTEATDGEFLTRPDGSDSAWKKLWNASRAAYWTQLDKNPAVPAQTLVSTPQQKLAAYFKLMGLQADGKTPTGEAPLLDVTNLIDYMIVIIIARNADSPLTGDGGRPNNFYCLRNRNGALGFMSFQHDAEHSLNAGGANDRWGPFENPISGNWNRINHSNPQFFHQDLSASPEYRIQFADHIYRHFFNNGPLTAARNQARLDRRASEVEPAIMAESARWGDAKTSPARNASHWRSARTATRTWFNSRSTQFVSEAKTRGFFPTIDPPVFNQRGGHVDPGFNVVLTNPNAAGGTVYYTTDGSDPRPVGGGFLPTVLIPEGANVSYLVPSTTNGGSTLAAANWTGLASPPNAANWSAGQMGLGFNPTGRPSTTNFTPFIKTDVKAAMQPVDGGANGSVYVRLPFSLTQTQIDAIDNLRLRVRYDDAYIAYLNGREVGRKVVSANHVPSWNSVSGTSHTDAASIVFEDLSVGNAATSLVAGDNVLAFHVMNQAASNSDLLFSVEVVYDTLSGAAGPAYTTPIALSAGTTIKTRVLNGMTWSALNEATFFTTAAPATASNLVVSEFSYNPAGPQGGAEAGFSSNDFEFIELQNISGVPIDLYNVRLGGAADLVLSTAVQQTILPPGARLVLTGNPAAFAARHGAVTPVLGPFAGSLDNSGETIRLTAADGSVIKEFMYSDRAPWPEAADGEGHSLVLVNPSGNPVHSQASNWRSSAVLHGQPGQPKSDSYAAWKSANALTDDSADTDGDGLTTFAEYGLGSSPTTPDFLRHPTPGTGTFVVGQATGQFVTIQFRRRLAADDVVYDIESSPSLTAGQWAGNSGVRVSETNHGDGTATVVYRALQPVVSGQHLFLRLRLASR